MVRCQPHHDYDDDDRVAGAFQSLIAKQLYRLSVSEREKALEDLHGVCQMRTKTMTSSSKEANDGILHQLIAELLLLDAA